MPHVSSGRSVQPTTLEARAGSTGGGSIAEVELHASIASRLDEASALGSGQALGVVVSHVRLERLDRWVMTRVDHA
jgi:hypothetical protein